MYFVYIRVKVTINTTHLNKLKRPRNRPMNLERKIKEKERPSDL